MSALEMVKTLLIMFGALLTYVGTLFIIFDYKKSKPSDLINQMLLLALITFLISFNI